MKNQIFHHFGSSPYPRMFDVSSVSLLGGSTLLMIAVVLVTHIFYRKLQYIIYFSKFRILRVVLLSLQKQEKDFEFDRNRAKKLPLGGEQEHSSRSNKSKKKRSKKRRSKKNKKKNANETVNVVDVEEKSVFTEKQLLVHLKQIAPFLEEFANHPEQFKVSPGGFS